MRASVDAEIQEPVAWFDQLAVQETSELEESLFVEQVPYRLVEILFAVQVSAGLQEKPAQVACESNWSAIVDAAAAGHKREPAVEQVPA